MTADWRATLERVAEKLAEARAILDRPTATDQDHYIRTVTAGAKIRRAHSALRALLAESQPDEPSAESKLARLADLTEGLPFEETDDDERLIERAIQLAWFHLGKPQVNPSEAKDKRWPFDRDAQEDRLRRERDHWKVAHDSAVESLRLLTEDVARAGLLAEGEESRKP